MAARKTQGKTAIRGNQFKPADIARGRHHITVMVINMRPQTIESDIFFLAMAQQADFIEVVLTLEVGNRLLKRSFAPVKRQILFDQGAHFRFERFQLADSQRLTLADIAVIAAGSNRMVDK